MKAAFITGHGGNDVVQVGERPGPERAPGEVRVRLHTATLNRVDLYMRDSGAGITHRLPQILGLDGAGVIDEIDASDALLQPGQRVLLHPGIACGRCEFCLRGDDVLCAHYQLIGEHRDGTFAQFVSVPARNVLPLPDDWSFAEGAAIGVNHLTAWRMLVTQAQIQPWETVLIFGIGGGVSLAGLQLAKALGARCIVTSRHAGKLEQARALGADHVIDASREDIAKTVLAATGGRGVDVVFENVGEAVWPAAMKSLVRGGRLRQARHAGVRNARQPPRTKGLWRRSWPKLLSGPWPGMNTVSSPIGHSRSRMLEMSSAWLPPGKSVRPMLPANSTSPTKARAASGRGRTSPAS